MAFPSAQQTTWTYQCSHDLIQHHSTPHHNHPLHAVAPGLCPSCTLHSLSISNLKAADAQALAESKAQCDLLSADLTIAKTKPKTVTQTKEIAQLERDLSEALEHWKRQMLSTSDARPVHLTKELKAKLIERYEEVHANISMLLQFYKLEYKQIQEMVEYEDCEYGGEHVDGRRKWEFCHTQERTPVPEDEVVLRGKRGVVEGLEKAKKGVEGWWMVFERVFDGEREGVNGVEMVDGRFEGAVEEWWGWVLRLVR